MVTFVQLGLGWRQRNGIPGALIHADSNSPMTPDLISELSAYVGDAALVGGMLGRNKPGLQIAVSVISGGLSGVLFGKGVPLVARRSDSRTPSPVWRVARFMNWIAGQRWMFCLRRQVSCCLAI